MNASREKYDTLPRFVYRRLAEALEKSPTAAERSALVQHFCDDIARLQPTGDWQKMKWCLPRALARRLSAEEKQAIGAALAGKRQRRNEKFLAVYPQCSDEFSTDAAFLDAAFGAERFGLIARDTKIFTIGSCFASNIAVFLHGKGYTVIPFGQAEDLNSPFSNAKMLALCAAPPEVRQAYVARWVRQLYPPDKNLDLAKVTEMELQRLDNVIAGMRASDFLVVTCGNVLDYFLTGAVHAEEPGPAVAPKFLSISYREDIALKTYLTHKLKEAGSEFRLGSYAEVAAALEALYAAIRAINPRADLLLTLSPVPIVSAVGMQSRRKLSAIEIDCISKSRLRSALDDFLESKRDDAKLYYFPSFEIVRWAAPCFGEAVFGKEDAGSHHVSEDVLNGVYRYFLHKFGTAEEEAEHPTTPREENALLPA